MLPPLRACRQGFGNGQKGPKMQFPFPLMVCDVGGTNARFAFLKELHEPLEMGLRLKTADFPGLEAASEAAIADFQRHPRSMIVCAAGPVLGPKVKLTNAHWVIDGLNVAHRLSLEQGLLFNDFEAQALSLPILRPEWVLSIGAPFERKPGTQLILGPGSGLGTGALLKFGGRFFPLTSEAGHVDFGPVNAEEAEFFPYIDQSEKGRIVAETLLSGHGILRLHAARLMARGLQPKPLSEAALVSAAKENRSGEEAATLHLFWLLLARFAGDLALTFMATGGVTFAGGVLPRLIDFLDVDIFRAKFESKQPYEGLMRSIPTRLVISEDGVLTGLAAVGSEPDNYALDYAGRVWIKNPG